MFGINWKVRAKSKTFWVAVIPLILVLAQTVLGWFGIQVPVEVIEAEALRAVNTVFLLLAALGVVADHTTDGLSDSRTALTYDEPKKDSDYIPRKGVR